ncbi:hypothetical protein B0T17DRAFT_531115 [Bombardia bombarda]|uniref:Uncharacterized protein n=1 Tax=Bombardia bombarda TaxID=252184 RepID=A0AA39X032_9PEZI|nr:hypothetical protein B0T17DRAFT_531115 [Bombardia bombarda]
MGDVIMDGEFLNPVTTPGIDLIWVIGSEQEVDWTGNFDVINIRMWQEDPERMSARPGETVFQNDSNPLPTSFKWKVDTYDFDTTRSN